jgi:hypothetical protein
MNILTDQWSSFLGRDHCQSGRSSHIYLSLCLNKHTKSSQEGIIFLLYFIPPLYFLPILKVMLMPKSFIPFGRKFPCKLSTLQNKLQHQNILISCLSLAAKADMHPIPNLREDEKRRNFSLRVLLCAVRG